MWALVDGFAAYFASLWQHDWAGVEVQGTWFGRPIKSGDNENPANYYSEQKFWASILRRFGELTTALESGLTTWPAGNVPRHSIEMLLSKDFLMTNFALAPLRAFTHSNPLPSIMPHASTVHSLHIIRTRLYTTMIKPAFWTLHTESRSMAIFTTVCYDDVEIRPFPLRGRFIWPGNKWGRLLSSETIEKWATCPRSLHSHFVISFQSAT